MRSFFSLLLIQFLFLFTFVAAWPWPAPFNKIEALVMKRQDSTSIEDVPTSAAASTTAIEDVPTSAAEGSSASITPAPTSESNSAAKSSAGDVTSSASGSKTAKETSKTTAKSSSTSYDARLPPGGIELISPAATAAATYYKIGDYVTFKWNYTSLSATPSAIDIMASCSYNDQLYTIALNQSTEPTGAVTWDTGNYQSTATIPLLTESYTLVIYDAASSISATAAAGYLGLSDQYTFGMYVPQAYTPLNEFKCATCSGALSDMERHAIGFTIGVAALTLISFTWFAGANLF